MTPKILIIDDDPASLAFMKYMLESYGHEVFAVGDSEAGLQMARGSKPDLILSDAEMPKLDGYELARRFKADESLHRIPLVAVTASAMKSDRVRISAAGFDGYIGKPFMPETFVSQVEEFLPAEMRSGGQMQSTITESTSNSPSTAVEARARFFRELADAFAENIPSLLADLRAASAEKNFKSLRSMAHKTLGSCIFLKEPELIEALRQLEKTIDANNVVRIEPQLQEVEKQARVVEKKLRPSPLRATGS